MIIPASSRPRASTAGAQGGDQVAGLVVEPGELGRRRERGPEHPDQRQRQQGAEHRGRGAGRGPVGQVEHHEHDQAGPDDRDGQRIVPGQDRGQHEHQQHDEAQRRARRARPARATGRAPARPRRRPPPARAAASRAGSRRSGTSPGRPGRRRTSPAPPGRPPRTAATRAPPARSAPGPGPAAARRPSGPRRAAHPSPSPSPGLHSDARVATTSARTGCWPPVVVGGRPPVGHSSTTPTSVASAQGTSSAAISIRTRRPPAAPGRARVRARAPRAPAGRRRSGPGSAPGRDGASTRGPARSRAAVPTPPGSGRAAGPPDRARSPPGPAGVAAGVDGRPARDCSRNRSPGSALGTGPILTTVIAAPRTGPSSRPSRRPTWSGVVAAHQHVVALPADVTPGRSRREPRPAPVAAPHGEPRLGGEPYPATTGRPTRRGPRATSGALPGRHAPGRERSIATTACARFEHVFE